MKVVPGEGPNKPRLIIIGEAPGEFEERLGRPFHPDAPAGGMLARMLSMLGISRAEVYLDNVVPIRPPANKLIRLDELGLTVAEFIPSLWERISKIECKVIIACGETALQALTGEHGITKHRGSIYGAKDRLIVPTFHPSYLIRDKEGDEKGGGSYKMKGVVMEDIKKGLRVMREGYTPPTFSTLIKPTLEEVDDYVNYLCTVPAWSFDIETVGSGQIACVGFAAERCEDGRRGRSSICIPFKHGYNNYWSASDEVHIWELFRRVFQSGGLKIGQNLNYDLTKLLPFIGEPAPPWYDLMIAHHLLDPELPHSLAFQTSLYTNPTVNYYKDDPKDEENFTWKGITSSETLWNYNGMDVEVPLMIEPQLTKELKDLHLYDFFTGYSMPRMRMAWRMQQRGMLVDQKKRDDLLTVQTKLLSDKQQSLNLLAGYELNANSPQQIAHFLYDELKLPKQYERKTKKLTTNEKALEKLYAHRPNPALNVILEIRGAVKEIGTYLMAEEDEDGRMRGRYNICGTTTGRSSASKGYEKRGVDWQNIPEHMRGMYIAPEGKVLITKDLWQAEAYVVAVLSQCQSFLARLTQGKKIYKLVASWLFNKPEEEVDDINKPGGEYFIGKRISHALNYGMGPELLAIQAKIPLTDAKRYRSVFFQFAPEIEQWHREIQSELRNRLQLVTPLGRKRYFRDHWGDDMFRKAYASTPQGTVADYAALAMIKLEYLLPSGAELVQEGFDGFVIEAWEDQEAEVDRLVEIAYDKRLFWKGMWFKIPVDGSIGKEWK